MWCGERRGWYPPSLGSKHHNNYLAPPETHRRAKSTGSGKVGAPFGNRNAVNPALAELRAFKAMVKEHIACMKAAIAAAEAIIAAQPRRPSRRINCHIYERDGVVMRVCARVRIARPSQAAKAPGLAPPSVPQTRPNLEKIPADPALRRGLSRRIPGAPAGLAQMVEHLICNQGVTGSSPVAGTRLRARQREKPARRSPTGEAWAASTRYARQATLRAQQRRLPRRSPLGRRRADLDSAATARQAGFARDGEGSHPAVPRKI